MLTEKKFRSLHRVNCSDFLSGWHWRSSVLYASRGRVQGSKSMSNSIYPVLHRLVSELEAYSEPEIWAVSTISSQTIIFWSSWLEQPMDSHESISSLLHLACPICPSSFLKPSFPFPSKKAYIYSLCLFWGECVIFYLRFYSLFSTGSEDHESPRAEWATILEPQLVLVLLTTNISQNWTNV